MEIVENDLLSYITSNHSKLSKEKLLRIIENFYSDDVIEKALKTLLSSIPEKRSTRRGRCVKNPDPLVAIYDCLQLIQPEDLPQFIPKDISNMPEIKLVNTSQPKFDDNKSECKPLKIAKVKRINIPDDRSKNLKINRSKQINISLDNEIDLNNQAPEESFTHLTVISERDDVSIYKKEQRQMRAQISEMVAIINDLKEGLKEFSLKLDDPFNEKEHLTLSQENVGLFQNGNIEEYNWVSDGITVPKISYIKHSHVNDGLTQLQKFIDEDDDNLSHNSNEEEDMSEIEYGDSIYMEVDETKTKRKRNKMTNQKKYKREQNVSFKNHSVIVIQNKSDKKVILVKEKDNNKALQHLPSNYVGGGMSEPETFIEISPADEFQLEELDSTQETTIEIPMFSTNVFKDEEIELEEQNVVWQQQCSICEKIFNNSDELWKHSFKEHVFKLPYICSLCKCNFKTRTELHKHCVTCVNYLKENGQINDYFCQICHSFYANQKALKFHTTFHSDSRKFSCLYCSLRYPNSAALNFHVKNNHSSQNTFLCSFCPLSFASKYLLSAHTSNHTGEKPFLCGVCEFKSASKTKLRTHLQSHSSQKKMKCKLCNYSCLNFDKLMLHIQKNHPSHSENKSNYFQYKTITSNPSLRRGGVFKCAHCLYTTALKSSEMKHIKTHLNPCFKCEECNVNLASRHNVARHLKNYCKKRHSAA